MTRGAILAAGLVMWLTSAVLSAEIDFVEDYVLAEDRSKALQLLVPGSEDDYYYRCLHLQSMEQYDKVDLLLKAWIKRYKYTPRVIEIQNRQALLTYGENPQQSLDLLRQRMKLRFNHQRERLGETPNLPTELDQQLISRARLTDLAMRRSQNLDGFEDSALDWLVRKRLSADRRRNLLQRLGRPDHPNLAQLVAADLKHRYAKPFGSMKIHRQLLLTQLEQLLEQKPDLLNQDNFVQTYISKLRPGYDADWHNDPAELESYLDRLWQFVSRLAPTHNSLKVHVLYHRLHHDRSQGKFVKNRFLTYLRLPRNARYVEPRFLAMPRNRQHTADLNADFRRMTRLATVSKDEPLVRSYLQHFLLEESSIKPYEPFVSDSYLRQQFAETKIIHGLGEPERWSSDLPADKYLAIKERIELDFLPTKKQRFAAAEPVSLELDVKNVRTLIVKVFHINTQNYYQQFGREVGTDVNLDGLVPNQELSFEYAEPPLRRVRRRYEFPELQKRGVYVIDFIGNGLSSRAVIHKGQLRQVVRQTTAGHLFTVFDDQNRAVPDATLWLEGREFTPDEKGQILVPYTDRPKRVPLVLSHAGFSSLSSFRHQAERFQLQAGFYVDRESLLQRRTAHLLVRPSLTLNRTPVTLSVLRDIRLIIEATDLDGVVTTSEHKDFRLFAERESIHELHVPARLASVQFKLVAQVDSLAGKGTIELSDSDQLHINQIAMTEQVDDLHLLRADGEYVLELRGRTGEPKPDQPVRVSLKHRHFRAPVDLQLQTGRRGRVRLGALHEIETISAKAAGQQRHWQLTLDNHQYHQTIHGIAEQKLEIPFMGPEQAPANEQLSLLELRGGTFHADRIASASIRDGMVEIEGLPAGDYDLLLKQSGRRIRLRLTDGPVKEGFALGRTRQLELRAQKPLQIVELSTVDGQLTIQLRNASRFSRVHLFASRYQPAFKVFGKLGSIAGPEPLRRTQSQLLSLYAAGRNIGDEYRYIIDRKYARKFPGIMLDRPSLLLSPWPVRDTQTGQQKAQEGNDFDTEAPLAPAGESAGSAKKSIAGVDGGFADLDFLAQATTVRVNLEPNAAGLVEVPLDVFSRQQHIHVVAMDPHTTAYRSLSLPEAIPAIHDLRLSEALDLEKHFTQQKRISIVQPGEKFTLEDVTTSRFESYDSLSRVYALYATLTANPHLAEFGFLRTWPALSDDEKADLYSKYACHELNFFLARKDTDFFETTVLPYLSNKLDRTFLDDFLLGETLDRYLRPWEYERLNVVERTLLSQTIDADRPYTRRDLRDRFALLAVDIDRFNRLFQTALLSRSLDVGNRRNMAGLGGMMGGGGGAADPLAASSFGLQFKRSAGRESGKDQTTGFESLSELSAAKKEKEGADASDRAEPYASRFFESESELRRRARQLYQKLDKTQEWAENNYYHLPIEQQNAELVQVNAFWRDYAQHDLATPFLSEHLAEAAGSFTEMMFAMSLLDLPFESAEHKSEHDGVRMVLTAGSPMIVFHEEIREATSRANESPILVSENFFQRSDRYRFEGNERRDKFVTDEFLVHTVYGCQVVVTNPTSSPQKLDVLLQIPVGSVPVLKGRLTKSSHVQLEPYNTQTLEYYFYFPAAGTYAHYPVQVARNEELIAAGTGMQLTAVEKLSRVDRTSWAYVSQNGSDDDVLEFLANQNLHRVDLNKIAFRMAHKPFFLTVVDLLQRRHRYDHTLWSYGIHHNHVPTIREFLQHADQFVQQCGLTIESPLLRIDPVRRGTHQHLDYRPLVNARVHSLGRRRQILNDRLHQQYHRFLKVLSYRRDLSDRGRLSLVYYLLLQDRVAEAMDLFDAIEPDRLKTRLQYDYFAAQMAMYNENTQAAREISAKYAGHKVNRWRNAFAAVDKQLDEIDGHGVEIVDPEQRNQKQTQLAATEPSFDFKVESRQVNVSYQNLPQVEVNYYLMDIELLYSRNPFVQRYSSQFSHIRPNLTETVALPASQALFQFPLPADLHNSNVLVELRGGGEVKSQVYYSNSLAVQLIENYGHLRATHTEDDRPLHTVYVKVFARMKDGSIRFYKDGYTDLRGRFDYASLNTNEIERVDRFSLLVFSEQFGAVVREAAPPTR